MRNPPPAMRGLVLALCTATACSFDASGSPTAGQSMSLGDGGSQSSDTGVDSGSQSADATKGDTTDGMDASGTTGAPGCDGGGGGCGAPAPVGWSGPFAVVTSSPANPDSTCPQGWSEHVYATRDLHVDPAVCGCTCTPAGGSCSAGVSYYSDAACTQMTTGGQVSNDDCLNLFSTDSHAYVRVTAISDGITCTPTPSKSLPPPTWSEGTLLCVPPVAPACDDGGVCLPATPDGLDARWCISANGEQACPNELYPQPIMVHRSITDDRDCSPCTCELQGPPTCSGSLDEFNDAFCLIPGDGVSLDGSCRATTVPAAGDNWSISYEGAVPTYACGGSPSTATGGATAAEPMTLCCTK